MAEILSFSEVGQAEPKIHGAKPEKRRTQGEKTRASKTQPKKT